MARTPNYSFERKERDRIKAAKKAEKLAAKAAKNTSDPEETEDQAHDKPEQSA